MLIPRLEAFRAKRAGLRPELAEEILKAGNASARESAHSGVGLGLSICKAIITAHGGRIRAENMQGGGARFVFTLPLEDAPGAPAENAAAC